MPIILTTTGDRKRCFATIHQILNEFIRPAISPAQRENLAQYMWALENEQDIKSVDALIQGDGASTTITIKLRKEAR